MSASYNDSLPFSDNTEQADIDNRDEVNEQSLRLALSRLGSKQSAPAAPAASTLRANARPFDTAQRRRKFVQDGDVRVEHQALNRPTTRAMHAPHDDGGEIERLRQQMRLLQKQRDDADRACQDAQASLRSLETRIGHADIVLAEAQAELASRDEDIMALKSSLSAARAEIARLKEDLSASNARPATPAPAKPAILRPRRAPAPAPETIEDEPEPVKWWIKRK
ncbi:hypothetical protein ACLRDC_11355 [Gluconacetobacter sacchari]|uniref:Uncharacterized protein n=2 Tax=Gluconacetobacter sacchari TaxID=92759 RepID=A0A7W4IE46_9PROT|nr:hypothetical protein [Gluconacetobacter sacchari]MBB2161104.1 hypothetical protein [Gluconacetobacter sacchari]GBQ26284.1 hypothetical protein AA12717_2305 [Gluconacetobacter sacchari DSM 12717]